MRALHCKSNKSQSLYGGDSICISLAANTKGNGFLSGHNDGTIIRYFMTDEASEPLGRVVQHPVPPFALAWPQGGFCAGGCDQRIIFYDSVVSCGGSTPTIPTFTTSTTTTLTPTSSHSSIKIHPIFMWHSIFSTI